MGIKRSLSTSEPSKRVKTEPSSDMKSPVKVGTPMMKGVPFVKDEKSRQAFHVLDSRSLDPKKLRRVTPFQFKVYDACYQIPAGQLSTYKAICDAIGGCPQAVGQALRCNPFAPEVPCHRVVAADGFVAGFSGQWGEGCNITRKQEMLQQEGVTFGKDGRVSWSEVKLFTDFKF